MRRWGRDGPRRDAAGRRGRQGRVRNLKIVGNAGQLQPGPPALRERRCSAAHANVHGVPLIARRSDGDDGFPRKSNDLLRRKHTKLCGALDAVENGPDDTGLAEVHRGTQGQLDLDVPW